MTKHVVGKVADFAPRTVKGLVIQDKPIMIVNIDGSLRAMDGCARTLEECSKKRYWKATR